MIEKRDLYYSIFKHANKIAIIVLSAITTSIIGVYVWPEVYETKTKFIVKLGRENASMPAGVQQMTSVVTSGVTKEDINSEIEIIKSRWVAEDVVNSLGIDYFSKSKIEPTTFFQKVKQYINDGIISLKDKVLQICYYLDLLREETPFERYVKAIMKKLSAENINNSDVIEIKLKWRDREKGYTILNTLIDIYLRRHSEIHSTKGTGLFFKEQLKDYQKRLIDTEERLKLFKYKNNISAINEQKGITLRQLGDYSTQLQQIVSNRNEIETIIANLKKQMDGQNRNVEISQEVSRNPLIDSYKMRIVDLESEKNKLLIKYPDTNLLVVNISEEIERLKKLIEDEEKRVLGTTKSAANETLIKLEESLLSETRNRDAVMVKEDNLSRYINRLNAELEKYNSIETELERLEREKRTDEENYLLYLKKFEESRISDVMDNAKIVNVNVIEPPFMPILPLWPKKLITILSASLASIIVGILYALFLEYISTSIKTEDDVEHYLQLPHLATIPEYNNILIEKKVITI